MRSRMEKMGFKASADKHVAQILDEAKARGEVGVGGEDVEGVVWSHRAFLSPVHLPHTWLHFLRRTRGHEHQVGIHANLD